MNKRDVGLQVNHLRTFRTVARELSFTRAALELNVTQPAVTHQIQALQRYFGVKLVDVVGRRVVLTEAGQFFAERTERFMDRFTTWEREMGEYVKAERGELRLGATVTIGEYALAPIVARFRREYPKIELNVRIDNRRYIAELVQRRELSAALLEGPLDDASLEVTPFQEDVLTIVARPDHPLLRRRAIEVSDLAGEHFVARGDGSGTRELLRSVLRSAGVEPKIVLSLPSGAGIVQAVEEGIGIAVLSGLVTGAAIAEGRIAVLPVRHLDLKRTFCLVLPRGATPAPITLAFAKAVRAA